MRKAQPQRRPHPDAAVEAQLQKVLSRYAAIARTEERLADITGEQKAVDQTARNNADDNKVVSNMTAQAGRLRAERLELEAFIAAAHEDIAVTLAALGNDALYLNAPG